MTKKKPTKKIIAKTLLTERFGTYPRIKILEFLINNRESSWGLKEIIQHARVKYRNAVDELKDLVLKDLVYIEKTLGKSHLYKINDAEPYIQSLIFVMAQKKR